MALPAYSNTVQVSLTAQPPQPLYTQPSMFDVNPKTGVGGTVDVIISFSPLTSYQIMQIDGSTDPTFQTGVFAQIDIDGSFNPSRSSINFGKLPAGTYYFRGEIAPLGNKRNPVWTLSNLTRPS